MHQEWVEFVEYWVEAQHEPLGKGNDLARLVLDDCIEHKEISAYRAHLVWCAFSDLRGYS